MKRIERTNCLKGHEYTEENTSYDARGHKICLTCRAEYARERYKVRGETIREAHQARRALKPEVTPEQRRRKNLEYIGWTPELFDKVLEEQQGLCAICKKVLTLEKKISNTRACADHEHCKPPKARGILCANCNLGIGNLQDDPEIMKSAITYIEKFGGKPSGPQSLTSSEQQV